MKKLVVTVLLVILLSSLANAEEFNCYTIVAGKNTTLDGSVLMGHNEDNGRKFVSGMWHVPRMKHEDGAFVTLQSGGRLPQADVTWAYWWLQMPELDYSDGLVNEHGVAIATNNCPSREDNPEISQGGIGGPVLRRIIAERAKTAREGVELLGSLIETYGYTASGRTMTICDCREGWLVAMVNGKHWLARRVADDEIAMIANTYSITSIDLDDNDNYLGSADIIEYAVKRGWYDPADGPFSFEAAYASPTVRVSPDNTHRQWSGLRHVADSSLPLPENERMPFSVKPVRKVTVADLSNVLRDHYEGSPYEKAHAPDGKRGHNCHASPICKTGTNASSVFQLRGDMPREIGVVWWLAMWQPCSTPFMPLYPGTQTVPSSLGFDPQDAGTCPFCVVSPEFGRAYRIFGEYAAYVDDKYTERIDGTRELWGAYETSNITMQKAVEETAGKLWRSDKESALELLRRYSHGAVSRAVQVAESALYDSQQE